MSIIGSIFVRLGLKSDEFSKGIKQSEGQLSSFKGVVGKIGGAIAGAFTVDKIVQFTKEAYKLAGQAQGVYNAFSRLNRPGLLNDLKEATRGTRDELKLMQTAVQANNFKIPLDQLATYLKFATNRAIETGESVDYLVQSIILGIGRKSPLILDNLGISASELREELAKTGDMGKAVGNIINKSMSEAGDAIETSAVKTQKLGAAWKDFMVAVGDSGAVKSTGNIITDTLTSITRAMSDLIKSGNSWSAFLGSLFVGGLGPLGAIFGGATAAGSAITGQRSKQNKIDAEDASAAKLAKKWADSAATIEEVNILLNSARSDSIDLTAKETQAFIEALMEKKKQLKAQEQEKIAREQTEKGIKAQIAALKELRAVEANPEKRASYTKQIQDLEAKLKNIYPEAEETKVKTKVDQINDAIDKLRKKREDATKEAQAGIDAEIEKLQTELDWINLTTEAYARFLAIKSGEIGNIAAGLSTIDGGKSFSDKIKKALELNDTLTKSINASADAYVRAKLEADNYARSLSMGIQTSSALNNALRQLVATGIQELATSLGNLMSGGEFEFDFSKLGNIIKKFGEEMIAIATACIVIFSNIFSNPWVALAAGFTLTALGAALANAKNDAQAAITGYSPTSSFTGGGNYSSSSMYAGGSNKYGHANKEDISVKVDITGRISGQDIVLASDKYLKNKAR